MKNQMKNQIKNIEAKSLLLKKITLVKLTSAGLCFENVNHDTFDETVQDSIDYLMTNKSSQSFEYTRDELATIAKLVDIQSVEECSCCGIVLMIDDEAYEDSDSNSAFSALCDKCSFYNEDTDKYERVNKAVEENKISVGKANGTIILTAMKMGYEIGFQFHELAVMLYQGDSIEPIYMGVVDKEASRVHNLIAKDKRIVEANKIALSMLAEQKTRNKG